MKFTEAEIAAIVKALRLAIDNTSVMDVEDMKGYCAAMRRMEPVHVQGMDLVIE